MKLWTCFSALVSSSFLATTATTRAVQPAPCGPTRGGVSEDRVPGGGTGGTASELSDEEAHHDPREQTHAFATVRVRHHVPVANGEEGDGDEPHGAQEVTGHFLFVMIPGGTQRLGEGGL